MFRRTAMALFILILAAPAGESVLAYSLKTQPVALGLTRPIYVTAAPGDSTRLFIIEQAGYIRIVKSGVLLSPSFLDIHAAVLSTGNEQGLLGLAFHPDYQNNGYFFVNYTAKTDGRTVVSRFRVTSNADSADGSSEKTVVTVLQPASNHNGGMMAFGPDGYLYIGFGDGGSAGDPNNLAQNPLSLLGKMLRIDPDTTATGGYSIPPSNPYFGGVSPRPEIWAKGLRNPWRWSFDRLAGDMFIADVGQGQWEEIDWQPASSTGGVNYGWRLKEGTHCYTPSTGCDTLVGLTDPIWEYLHEIARCSITGGYVYRGCAIPDLQGVYLFGDYCSGEIWALTQTNGTVTGVTNLDAQIGRNNFDLVSFGEDYFGEMYICNLGSGTVVKIVPTGPAFSCGPCCVGITGNVDNSAEQSIDVGDLTAMVQFLFLDGATICMGEANTDGSLDANVDIGDLTRLIDFLFLTSAPLGPCL